MPAPATPTKVSITPDTGSGQEKITVTYRLAGSGEAVKRAFLERVNVTQLTPTLVVDEDSIRQIRQWSADDLERKPSLDFPLSPWNGRPRGMTKHGNIIFVVDDEVKSVFRYDITTKKLAAQTAFFALDTGVTHPTAAWASASTLWVNDEPAPGDSRLLAYSHTGTRQTSNDKTFPAVVRHVRGLWSDGTHFYVADNINEDKILAFTIGPLDRATTVEHDLISEHQHPRGLVGNTTHLYSPDRVSKKIISYARSGGATAASPLDLANREPRGIVLAGNDVWVVDSVADMMFGYKLPTSSSLSASTTLAVDDYQVPSGVEVAYRLRVSSNDGSISSTGWAAS